MLVVGAPELVELATAWSRSRRGAARARTWSRTPPSIDPAWLAGATCVGVTAGASTPEVLVQEVIERLRGARAATRVERAARVDEGMRFTLPAELQARQRSASTASGPARSGRSSRPRARRASDGGARALGVPEPARAGAQLAAAAAHADLAPTRERWLPELLLRARARATRAQCLGELASRYRATRGRALALGQLPALRARARLERLPGTTAARATRTGARSSPASRPRAPDDVGDRAGLDRDSDREVQGPAAHRRARPVRPAVRGEPRASCRGLADRCLAAALARRRARERSAPRPRCSRSASSAARELNFSSRRRPAVHPRGGAGELATPSRARAAGRARAAASRNTSRCPARTGSAIASIWTCGPRAATGRDRELGRRGARLLRELRRASGSARC